MNEYIEEVAYYFPEMQLAVSQTVRMMSISMIFTFIIGLPLGIFLYLTRQKKQQVRYSLLNTYVNIVRSFPFLLFVVALIPFTRFLLGTAFGTTAASVPLAFVGIAMFGRLVEQVLLDLPKEVMELAESLGATWWQLIWEFLLVEARSGIILSFTSVTISLVSYSTVMGIVGGGGVGDFAIRYGYQTYRYSIMYTTIVLMILTVAIVQWSGNSLSRILDKRK